MMELVERIGGTTNVVDRSTLAVARLSVAFRDHSFSCFFSSSADSGGCFAISRIIFNVFSSGWKSFASGSVTSTNWASGER
jgi:hypothetical protein